MENNDRNQAREALDAIASTRSDVAARLVTPWFYHPVLGLSLAVLVLVHGFGGSTMMKAWTSCGCVLVALGMITWYTRRTGLAITGTGGPRSRRAFAWCCVVMAAPLVYVVVLEPSKPFVVALAVITVVGTTIFGRRYDEAYRADLREGAQ
ncbi:hypothetical protein [Nocardioides sp. AE5]|uniref:hypothetical protein n=1 Tax=Nocardioides sp. AE5 TaxID=2962573 RepID=UPI002880FB72|nr:hypothetical protein [Nocardioides sp. AE5]MDT0200352.1 hypothetical protein [Nocardioides sp. AE5]